MGLWSEVVITFLRNLCIWMMGTGGVGDVIDSGRLNHTFTEVFDSLALSLSLGLRFSVTLTDVFEASHPE